MIRILPAFLLLLASHATAVPVILDTDLGDDIDDTWALGMLLNAPEVELKLIVTAFRDTPTKTRLAAKILEDAGRSDVPIGTGKKTGEQPINQEAWLGDYDLENYAGTVHEDGVDAMIKAIHASPEPILLCVIGPQTNIAEALKRDPAIAQKARVISMAGSVHIGYNGKAEADPEWNVRADVPAAQAVFAAPWPITYAPLDTCGTLVLDGDHYKRVCDSPAAIPKTIIENYEAWKNRKHHAPDKSSVLFDTLATYFTYAQDFVEMETVKLRIDERGMTLPDPEHGRPVTCALTWTDKTGFKDHLVTLLSKN